MVKGLVSIIIPVYNREKLIIETLDSIINQTFLNWECIVVDDGSSDKTFSVLQNYAKKDNRFKPYKRPSNKVKGANSCRNFGFEKSKGEYIQWFDSDDIMLPLMLEKKTHYIKNKFDFILCSCVFFNEVNDNKWSKKLIVKESIMLDYFSNNIIFNTPTSFWRRKTVVNYRFNEQIKRAQELDFFSRILLNEDVKGRIINEELVLIREHNDSITAQFHLGDETKIFNDLNVRFSIVINLKKNTPKRNKNIIFYLYLKTIQNALKNKFYIKTISHLFFSIYKTNWAFKFKILRILFLTCGYISTGKGWELMKVYINKHNI